MMERDAAFAERDGRIIIDIAAARLPEKFSPEAAYRGVWDEWVAEDEVPGFTGDCYYRWAGPELKVNPGCGVLAYDIFIDEPGLYLLSMRNWSIGPGKANAAFLRVDGGQWHKVKSKVHGEWTWSFMYEHYHDDANPSRVPCWRSYDHGYHRIEIAGRCNGFLLDRIALGREGVEIEDLTLEPSEMI
jgi:hypothetical protein